VPQARSREEQRATSNSNPPAQLLPDRNEADRTRPLTVPVCLSLSARPNSSRRVCRTPLVTRRLPAIQTTLVASLGSLRMDSFSVLCPLASEWARRGDSYGPYGSGGGRRRFSTASSERRRGRQCRRRRSEKKEGRHGSRLVARRSTMIVIGLQGLVVGLPSYMAAALGPPAAEYREAARVRRCRAQQQPRE
jgi:hypothetical protein